MGHAVRGRVEKHFYLAGLVGFLHVTRHGVGVEDDLGEGSGLIGHAKGQGGGSVGGERQGIAHAHAVDVEADLNAVGAVEVTASESV